MSRHLRLAMRNYMAGMKHHHKDDDITQSTKNLDTSVYMSSDYDTLSNFYDATSSENMMAIWSRIRNTPSPPYNVMIYEWGVRIDANFGTNLHEGELPICLPHGFRFPRMHFGASIQSYDKMLEGLNQNTETNIKLQRELEKGKEFFKDSFNQKIEKDLNKVINFIDDKLQYEKLGIELSKSGSFIFTVIMKNDLSLYLVYNSLEEDDEGKMYYRIFANGIDVVHQLGSINEIIDSVINNELIESDALSSSGKFICMPIIPDDLSFQGAYYPNNDYQYNEIVPNISLIPDTIPTY